MMYHTAQKVGIPIMKTLTGLNRQWLLKTVLSTSMIVTVSVPQSSATNIVGSKQERSNTTLFQTKISKSLRTQKSGGIFTVRYILILHAVLCGGCLTAVHIGRIASAKAALIVTAGTVAATEAAVSSVLTSAHAATAEAAAHSAAVDVA